MTNEFHFTAVVELCRKTHEEMHGRAARSEIRQTPSAKSAALSLSLPIGPDELKSSLPTVDEIEAELGGPR